MNYNGFPATYNPFLTGYQQGFPQPVQQPIPQPYQNTVPVAPQQPTATVQSDDRIFVNGEQEALSWVVLRGQSVRLWDRNGTTFYIKAVSDTGQPLPLEIYDYHRRDAAIVTEPTGQLAFNPDEFVKHSEFDEFKKQITRRRKKEDPTDDAEE